MIQGSGTPAEDDFPIQLLNSIIHLPNPLYQLPVPGSVVSELAREDTSTQYF